MLKKKESQIDVILPVFNGEKFIEECLNSIYRQNIKINLIIINDGSTDRTGSIIKRWIYDHSIDVTLVTHDKPLGVSRSRNDGLQVTRCEYVSFVDADDLITKDHFLKLLNAFEKNGSPDIVASGITRQKKVLGKGKDIAEYFTNERAFKQIMGVVGVQGYACNKVFKTNIIEKYKLSFDEQISVCEDLLFVVSYFLKSNQVLAYVPIPSYYYRPNQYSVVLRKQNYHDTISKFSNELLAYSKISEKISRFENCSFKKIVSLKTNWSFFNCCFELTKFKRRRKTVKWIKSRNEKVFDYRLFVVGFFDFKTVVKNWIKAVLILGRVGYV